MFRRYVEIQIVLHSQPQIVDERGRMCKALEDDMIERWGDFLVGSRHPSHAHRVALDRCVHVLAGQGRQVEPP